MAKTTTKRTRRSPLTATPKSLRRTSKSPQDVAAKAVSTSLAAATRVVTCMFPQGNGRYSYHTNDPTIQVGDYCIVISPHSYYADESFAIKELAGYPAVVRVTETRETTQAINKASKWIVQKLDIANAIAAAAKQQQIEVLMAKITKARKAAEERVKLEQLRDLSPELDSLISELDALQS